MPHHKSAAKRLKTAARARMRNVAVKSLLKKQLKAQRDTEGAKALETLPQSYRELDRAARKGVIPQSRADRLKSRLARQANQPESA